MSCSRFDGHSTSRYWIVVGRPTVEVDLQGPVGAAEAQLDRRPLEHRRGHPVHVAVAVPRDHAGALAGVGRRDVLPDEGVQQRRLPRLDLAGDGHAQRAVEAPAQLGDAGHVRLTQHRLGLVEQPVDGRRQRRRGAHDAIAPTATRRSAVVRSWRTVASSASWSARRRADPGSVLGARRLGGLDRLLQRALEQLEALDEVVADLAVGLADGVAGVLLHDEADLVEVAGREALHLDAALGLAPDPIVEERPSAHVDRGRHREHGDEGHDRDVGADDAEHRRGHHDAAVEALCRRDEPADEAALVELRVARHLDGADELGRRQRLHLHRRRRDRRPRTPRRSRRPAPRCGR